MVVACFHFHLLNFISFQCVSLAVFFLFFCAVPTDFMFELGALLFAVRVWDGDGWPSVEFVKKNSVNSRGGIEFTLRLLWVKWKSFMCPDC